MQRRGAALLAFLVVSGPLVLAQTNPTDNIVQVSERTQVPGGTLAPGTYQIKIVDSLKDRSIVEIDGPNETHLLFLGVNATNLPSAPGAVPWNRGASTDRALRGFVFPDKKALEFVYPKADAVALAQKNSNGVVAIDPASEGRATKGNLPKDDLQMINLWLLTPTLVGPEKTAGISAKKFEQPQDSVAVSKSSPLSGDQVATNTPPRDLSTRHVKPVASSLPHTASNSLLLWVFAVSAFAGASYLKTRRMLRS